MRQSVFRHKLSAAIESIDITRMLEKRRWTWLGHVQVLRMDPNRNPKRALALQFGTPLALTAHLPEHVRNVRKATLLATDRENCDNISKENRFRRLCTVFTVRCPRYTGTK